MFGPTADREAICMLCMIAWYGWEYVVDRNVFHINRAQTTAQPPLCRRRCKRRRNARDLFVTPVPLINACCVARALHAQYSRQAAHPNTPRHPRTRIRDLAFMLTAWRPSCKDAWCATVTASTAIVQPASTTSSWQTSNDTCNR